MRKKLLLVAYYFPPHNFVGAYRPFRFARYLSRMGWEVTVLSAQGPEKRRRDDELLKFLPESVDVHRVPAPEAGEPSKSAVNRFRRFARTLLDLVTFPDKKLLWVRRARPIFRKLIDSIKPDVVLITAPPYSSLWLGFEAGKMGIPWVADFRDAWVEDALNAYRTPLHRRLARSSERRVLGSAAASTFVNRWLLRNVAERNPEFADRLHLISNGFDPELLPRAVRTEDDTVVSYIGTLYDDRKPDVLIRAAKLFLDRHPGARIRLRFVGKSEYDVRLTARRWGFPEEDVEHIEFTGYRQAAEMGISSTALWLIVSHREKAASLTAPGKLYDYIGFMRPIIASVPDGVVREIVAGFSDSFVVAPDDEVGLANALSEIHSMRVNGEMKVDVSARQEFDIRKWVERLDALLKSLT